MGNISEHFNREEFSCKCTCGFNTVDAELLKILEGVRSYFGKPVIINSSCRCETHNKSVGGGEHSQHLIGRAADIVIHNISPDEVYNYFDSRYPTKYGLGKYSDFTHIDSRSIKGRW